MIIIVMSALMQGPNVFLEQAQVAGRIRQVSCF
jgi:hypothetical protein